jgi:hypothetical protein
LSLSISSPTSTQPSRGRSLVLSTQEEYSETETELESIFDSDGENTSDDDEGTEDSDPSSLLLESHLFSVLGHDLELAARLIPQIYKQVHCPSETTNHTKAPVDNPSGGGENYSAVSSMPEARSNDAFGNNSRKRKRERHRDESEDRGRQEQSEKRRKKPGEGPVDRPRFACHFHKKDPEKYCPLNDRKYRCCIGPGPFELRRIK